MSKNINVKKSVGEVSSKYGYQPNKFDEDMKRHAEESKQLYEEFRNWMIEKDVDPIKFRLLFMEYYDEFIK